MKLFKKTKVVTFWMVDDDTIMPIAYDNEKTAKEIVEKHFNGEYDRIYTITKKNLKNLKNVFDKIS